MKKSVLLVCFCLLMLLGCETIPIVGRSQLSLIPTSQLITMSKSSFSKLLSESKLSEDKEKVAMVASRLPETAIITPFQKTRILFFRKVFLSNSGFIYCSGRVDAKTITKINKT